MDAAASGLEAAFEIPATSSQAFAMTGLIASASGTASFLRTYTGSPSSDGYRESCPA